jgi:hypothetical protein
MNRNIKITKHIFRVFIIVHLFFINVVPIKVSANYSHEPVFLKDIRIEKGDKYYNYYKSIELAENLVFENRFLEADSVYSFVFKHQQDSIRGHLVDAFNAFLNAKNNNLETARLFLEKSVSLGLTKKLLKREKMLGLLNSEERKIIPNKNNQTDKSTEKLINKMCRKDQRKRAFWTDWLSWKNQKKLMYKTDSLNSIKLIRMFKSEGYPGFSKMGETELNKYSANNLLVLLLHFGKEEITEILPILLEAVKNGEMYPHHLARIIDYLFMVNTIKDGDNCHLEIMQFYGVMIGNDEIIPYKSIENVNSLRENLCLGKIEVYAKKRNVALPESSSLKLKCR